LPRHTPLICPRRHFFRSLYFFTLFEYAVIAPDAHAYMPRAFMPTSPRFFFFFFTLCRFRLIIAAVLFRAPCAAARATTPRRFRARLPVDAMR